MIDENLSRIRRNDRLIRRLKVSNLLDCVCAGLCVGFSIGILFDPLIVIPLALSMMLYAASIVWGKHLLRLSYEHD